jgi:hypothetical protein
MDVRGRANGDDRKTVEKQRRRSVRDVVTTRAYRAKSIARGDQMDVLDKVAGGG